MLPSRTSGLTSHFRAAASKEEAGKEAIEKSAVTADDDAVAASAATDDVMEEDPASEEAGAGPAAEEEVRLNICKGKGKGHRDGVSMYIRGSAYVCMYSSMDVQRVRDRAWKER